MKKRPLCILLTTLTVLHALWGCTGAPAPTAPSETVTVPPTTVPEPTETLPTETAPTEPPTTEPLPTETIPTEPPTTEPPTIPTQTIPTDPVPTEPPITEPSTPTAPAPPKYPFEGALYSRQTLETMDITLHGYGQGLAVDQRNRPHGALDAQKKWEGYDAWFIGPLDTRLYLTFDEGYENGYTPQILDTLKEKDVKAVFFVTKSYCKQNPDLIRRMIDEGHALGNHSVRHLSMPTLTIDQMADEIMGLHTYVKETFGYEMHLFRPPMGEYSQLSLAVAQNLGYKTVEWSFAYYDYDPEDQPTPAAAYDRIVGAAHSGGIFLLHAVSQTNTAILGSVIDTLRSVGYDLALFD
ncbi:MAG: polysaccharide deacetylase family protein [Oscillospiraceae bacterium]|nr:polysaccharide deacetylase family protein [Oscillospiraceae bacterium]